MGLFGNNSTVTTTFKGKDDLSPVVRGMRNTMEGFKRDAKTGFGLAGGISIFNTATRAIGMVTDALGDSLNAYREDRLSQSQLHTALRANIDAWDGNAEAIERVIAARMDLGFSDDEQRASLALLVAQIKDVDDALAIQRTAMDLARLKGTSLAESATLLAKAYNGSATGLQRMGINVRKGARGMEALGEVQKRVAGQAEAFAETATGASERLNVKIGELQESIGGFIDGPATEFVNWLNDIVDAISGGAGDAAFKALGQRMLDIKNGVVETTAAVEGGKGPWESYLDGLQAVNDVMNPSADEARDFRRSIDDLRKMAGLSEQAIVDMFFAFKDAGKMGSEGAKKAVLSIVNSMILANETTSVTTPLLSDGWADAMGSIERSTVKAELTMEDALAGMRQAVRDTMSGAFATMDQAKEPWKQAWQDMAAWVKDPFKPAKFENWVQDRINAAFRKAKQAEENHRPGIAKRWRRIGRLMKDPVFAAMVSIGVSVDQALADIALVTQAGQALNNFLPNIAGVFGNDGDGEGAVGHATPVPRKRKKKKHKAIGGSASGEFVAGEYGPEVVSLGSAKAHVSTAQASRGDIVLAIDGQVLMRWIDNRMGRSMALYGLGG